MRGGAAGVVFAEVRRGAPLESARPASEWLALGAARRNPAELERVMKLLFGIVSMLLAVAVVGVLASRQMSATRSAAAPPASETADATPRTAASAARTAPQQIRNELQQALDQAARRTEAAP